ncbi:g1120 [Coccomyxa elongata]
MRPHRSEYKQVPATSSVPPACSYGASRQQAVLPCRVLIHPSAGHAFNTRRPLLLLTQLSNCRGTTSLQSLAESNACGSSRLPRGRLRQARRLLMLQADCGCRHLRSRARSGNRRAAATAAVQEGSSEGEPDTLEGAEFLAEGWQPGDGVRPTPQQELLLLQLLASPAHRELFKKQIVLLACILGVDVVPALEQARLDLDWLVGQEPPRDFLDAVMLLDDPLDAYWEMLSTLFEDVVKGRRKSLEQPAGAKKGFGASSGSGGGGGKGRKTKPRKAKSGYALVSEVKTKEQMRQRNKMAAEQAAHDADLIRLMEGWTEDEKDAYVMATYFWDVSWALLVIGVNEFLKAGCSGGSSLSTCVELLMTIRMFLWRSINSAHGEGNAGGPQGGVKDALQGLVAKKVLDMIELAAGKRVNLEVSFVSGSEDTTLAEIMEATEEKPALMPPPPASAFAPSAKGGLSIVEELLARQVMGSVQAWQEASVQDRMERLVAPGWKDFWPLVERSLKRLSAEDAKMATRMVGLISTPFEVFPLPALHVSAMEVSSGSDNSTAAESAEDMQAPPQAAAVDVAMSADRRFAMFEAPPISAPVLWTTTTEPAEQSAMQATAGETLTDSSVEAIDSSNQAGTASHAEPSGVSAAAREPAASSGALMDSIASPEVAWSGVDSWAAAAASIGGVPFAAPDQAIQGGPLDVQQQSTAAPLAPTAEAAAEASANGSWSSGGVEVGTTTEAAGAGVSADSSRSSYSAELQNTAGNPLANATAAANLSADRSRSNRNDEKQSRTDDVRADAQAAADRTSNGSLPSSGGTDMSTADSAAPNAAAAAAAQAQAAAAQLDSSWRRSNGEQRRRTEGAEVDAVDAASNGNGSSMSRSSRRGQLRTADGSETDAAAAANGARSNSSRWSTADGMKEPADRRENFSSSSRDRERMTGRGQGQASEAPELPASSATSSAASSSSAVWWSQLAVRPVLPAEQRLQHQDVSSDLFSSTRQPRRSVKKARAPFGGSTLVDGTYLAKQLLPHDQRHWKAAGILLYARGQDGTLQLLLGRIDMGTKPAGPAKAWRRHEGWWILGGSRDATDFCAEATAVREMTEETAGILSGYNVCGDDFGQVLWYPPGMYAVFPYELQGRPDIPGRYARLRAMRGRVKGRRRQLMFRAAGHPKPMSQLAWVPLRDLINGRLRMHWILEDMLRRTPLLPYLLQMERLAAESALPTGRPLQLGPPGPSSSDEPDRYPPSAKPGRGSPQHRSGGHADRTSAQQNGTTASWTASDGEEGTMAGARSGARPAVAVISSDTASAVDTDIMYNNGARPAAAVVSSDIASALDTEIMFNNGNRTAAAVMSSDTATAVDLDEKYNNGVAATAAAAAVMASARSGAGAGAAAAAAPEAAGLARPRAAGAVEGEATFAAVAEAAREFLKARGPEVETEEEGTQRERDTGRALVQPVVRTLKRRRQRLKRAKLARAH